MNDIKAFAEELCSMSVTEVKQLMQTLKNEYGIESSVASVVVSSRQELPYPEYNGPVPIKTSRDYGFYRIHLGHVRQYNARGKLKK